MSNDDSPQPPAFDPANSQSYNGICHCGTVQYTMTLSPPLAQQKVVECNCSICSRNGYLLVYPSREHFVLHSGEEALRSYSFGPGINLHKFCSQCGSSVFFDPKMLERGMSIDLLGVNVRMLKDAKIEKSQIVQVDGWNNFPFVNSDHLQ